MTSPESFHATTPVNSGHVSLEGMHDSVSVPSHDAGFWQQWRAFVGPAILISVGYMDPGNWSTDLAGGAQFKYGLLWVVAVASVMAIFMQVIASRLGVVSPTAISSEPANKHRRLQNLQVLFKLLETAVLLMDFAGDPDCPSNGLLRPLALWRI
jgi:manganese transport protein